MAEKLHPWLLATDLVLGDGSLPDLTETCAVLIICFFGIKILSLDRSLITPPLISASFPLESVLETLRGGLLDLEVAVNLRKAREKAATSASSTGIDSIRMMRGLVRGLPCGPNLAVTRCHSGTFWRA